MMCEHKNIDTAVNYPVNPFEVQIICLDCQKFIGTPNELIYGLHQQLAAANARIEELERDLLFSGKIINGQSEINGQEHERAEQAEAQAAAMRIQFEKYVRNNCRMIEKLKNTIGAPDLEYGKCQGYTVSKDDDEPHDNCKECIAAFREEEEPDAGSALLARMEKMRGALSKIIESRPAGNARNLYAEELQKMAAEALDGRDGKPGKVEDGKE